MSDSWDLGWIFAGICVVVATLGFVLGNGFGKATQDSGTDRTTRYVSDMMKIEQDKVEIKFLCNRWMQFELSIPATDLRYPKLMSDCIKVELKP